MNIVARVEDLEMYGASLEMPKEAVKSQFRILWTALRKQFGFLGALNLLAVLAFALQNEVDIALIVIGYSLLAFVSFLALNIFNRIMLPSFNIPYSVLLMGLIGSLVSMYVKLPNLRVSEPLSYDQTVWFIINPPIAVIMAGVCFGLIQIFLPLLPLPKLCRRSCWVISLNPLKAPAGMTTAATCGPVCSSCVA